MKTYVKSQVAPKFDGKEVKVLGKAVIYFLCMVDNQYFCLLDNYEIVDENNNYLSEDQLKTSLSKEGLTEFIHKLKDPNYPKGANHLYYNRHDFIQIIKNHPNITETHRRLIKMYSS